MASGLYALTIMPSACARSCLRAAPQSDGAEEAVGSKRRKCAVVIAVFERGEARVRRQYVQQQGRAGARQARDVNGRVHRPARQPALEQPRLQLAHVNPKVWMRMHQPAEKTHQPRLIEIRFHRIRFSIKDAKYEHKRT